MHVNTSNVVLSAAMLARFAMAFQYSAVGAMGAALIVEYNMTLSQLGWLVSLFTLPAIVMALPGGAISQRYGDISPAMAALGLLLAGASLCAVTENYTVLLVGRTLSGVGATLITLVTGTVLSRWFTGGALSRAMAVSMFSWPLGIGIALAAIPSVASFFGVGSAFFLTGLSAAVPLLIYAKLWRRGLQAPYGQATVSRVRVTDLTGSEVKLITAAALLWTVFNGSFILFLSFGPVHVQGGPVSAVQAGLIMTAALVSNGLATLMSGRINDFVGRPVLTTAICSIILAMGLAIFIRSGTSTPTLILIGLASGLPIPPLIALIVSAFPNTRRNISMGVFYLIFYASLSIVPPIAGRIGDVTQSLAAPLWAGVVLSAFALLLLPVFHKLRQKVVASGS